MMFYKDKCKGCGKYKEICPSPNNCVLCGKCTFYCPVDARKVCGKEYTVDEVLAEIIKDKSYYDTRSDIYKIMDGFKLIYEEETIHRVEKIVLEQMRRYGYLFS